MILMFQVQGASGPYNPYQALYEVCQKHLPASTGGANKPEFVLTQETAQKVLNDLRQDTRGLNTTSLDPKTQEELQAVETLLLAIANPNSQEYQKLDSRAQGMVKDGLTSQEIYDQKGGYIDNKTRTNVATAVETLRSKQGLQEAEAQRVEQQKLEQEQKAKIGNPQELNNIKPNLRELHHWQKQFEGKQLERSEVTFQEWKAMTDAAKQDLINKIDHGFKDVTEEDLKDASLEEVQQYKNHRYMKLSTDQQKINELAQEAKKAACDKVDTMTANTLNHRAKKVEAMHRELLQKNDAGQNTVEQLEGITVSMQYDVDNQKEALGKLEGHNKELKKLDQEYQASINQSVGKFAPAIQSKYGGKVPKTETQVKQAEEQYNKAVQDERDNALYATKSGDIYDTIWPKTNSANTLQGGPRYGGSETPPNKTDQARKNLETQVDELKSTANKADEIRDTHRELRDNYEEGVIKAKEVYEKTLTSAAKVADTAAEVAKNGLGKDSQTTKKEAESLVKTVEKATQAGDPEQKTTLPEEGVLDTIKKKLQAAKEKLSQAF